MGYLQDNGQFFDYYESQAFQQLIKEKGIIQFLYLMKKYQDFQVEKVHYDHVGENEDCTIVQEPSKIFWGDEIEGHIVRVFPDEKKVLLQPNIGDLFQKFETMKDQLSFIAMPEYGSWMLETTPDKPYYHLDYNITIVLRSLRNRLRQVQENLPDNTYYLLLPVFPRLGTKQFSVTIDSDLDAKYMEKVRDQTNYLDKSPQASPMFYEEQVQNNLYGKKKLSQFFPIQGDSKPIESPQKEQIYNIFSNSQFIDDRLINPHPRYSCLTLNQRLRRGSKAQILIPIFQDKNTKQDKTEDEPFPGFIYMDHFGFGMGNCSLQMTFLSKDINHARLLYDQFAVISPLFIALSAGSAIFKGKLADWDSRWDCLSMAVDDRTDQERDPGNKKYIPKSKYSSISTYISNHPMNKEEYNDVKFPRNEEIMNFARLKSKEMGIELDERLLNHLGILYLRDAMVIYKDKVHVKDDENTNHFENIQSTNWNSVRFKPPPSQNSSIGWRVEFRTTEIQVTPDENSVLSILILRIAQLFYYTNTTVNFYIPLSLVDENFKRSRTNNAIMTEKFYFRTNIQDEGPPIIAEMTLDEIFFGKKDLNYIGIMQLIETSHYDHYTKNPSEGPKERIEKSNQIYDAVSKYIRKKTTGQIKTLAQYTRDFVMNHPAYQRDSLVSDEIQYDLITRFLAIMYGNYQDPHFPNIFSISNK